MLGRLRLPSEKEQAAKLLAQHSGYGLRIFMPMELTAAQLNAAYQAGQRHFAWVEIIGEDEFPSVSNFSLNAAEFISCWFHSVTFENVDFRRARFVDCNLKCATFTGCNLSGSSWEACAVCSLSISTCDDLLSHHLREALHVVRACANCAGPAAVLVEGP